MPAILLGNYRLATPFHPNVAKTLSHSDLKTTIMYQRILFIGMRMTFGLQF